MGGDNDVGQIRAVMMHRPGTEFDIIDETKRIESIGSFGDPEEGWYFQSDTIPALAAMQAQHDALAQALRGEGVEVIMLQGETGKRFKSCYPRDSSFAVKGGAIVCRLAAKVRRGEELALTRTLVGLGLPDSLLQSLKDLKVRCIEFDLEDNGWIVNGLAVRPGRVIMPLGLSDRTREKLALNKIELTELPYDDMHPNGGGIHCSTCPLIRDSID